MTRRRLPFPFLDPTASQYDFEAAMDEAHEAEDRAEREADDARDDE